MIRFIRSSVSRKMLAGLLVAEMLSLTIILLFTFFITKPRLEAETIEKSQRTGQQLAHEIDLILERMWLRTEQLLQSEELRRAIESGEDNAVSAILTSASTGDMRAAVLYNETAQWHSVYSFDDAEMGYIYFPTMRRLNGNYVGPVFSSIYLTEKAGASVNIAALVTDGEEKFYIVCVFDAEGLMETITDALSYDYTGFDIGQIFGPGFYSGGDSGNAVTILSQHPEAGNYTITDDTGCYVITQSGYSWRICGFISSDDLAAAYMPNIRNAIYMCLLMLVLSVLTLQPFLHGVVRPVRCLQQDMAAAAAGDLTVRADTGSLDELGQLGHYFNDMLDQIRAHMHARIRMEAAEYDLRQELLVSQVNYHFIYNTMSSINALARRQDCENIIAVNTALSEILQNNMHLRSDDMTCTVENELKAAFSYWTIERICRKGNADLTVDCPSGLRSARMPHNVLQPLVENSLRHGIVDEETGMLDGEVTIRVRQAGERLSIEVSDNGRGIPPEMLERLNCVDEAALSAGRHIGLANIRKRLQYLYGDKASMVVRDSGGATITIEIPI